LIARTNLARAIGIGNQRLASYEEGRAPVPYGVFLRLWKQFQLNPEWLARGDPPREIPVAGFDRLIDLDAIEERRRFFDVYTSVLAPVFGRGDVRLLAILHQVNEEIDSVRRGDPESEAVKALRKKLLPIAMQEAGIVLIQTLALRNYGASPIKTSVASNDMVKPGKLLLDDLRERFRRAASARGVKTQLARLFGVTPGTVTQWINGPAKPSAENTLALLAWVESVERLQQENAGRVDAQPALKTRKSQSTIK
jgi:transcriptional regulator with XRE-family HTH domain